ncbi:MAG: ubiquinone biosynthesis regulatory protein kinase UbiB [Gammaproteobacteria bacterium]|nr:MAG: ubiquinone biosynthesis regulatory protein kinase UbiB [Gammaproteobacteria bacterium]
MVIFKPAQLLRILYINVVLVKHGLDEIILATHLLRPIRFIQYLAPWYWIRGDQGPRGVRIRLALEELGPIFVKFGQILSTREDLLAQDIAEELARLQDKVSPFPAHQAIEIIEAAYGKPVSEIFENFEESPLASASIAQVHAATLAGGRQVIVKVLRPNIEKQIRCDVGLLYYIAALADRFWSEGKRMRPLEVVAQYEQTILDELDFMREAANASQLRRNFSDNNKLYVPEIHWPLARRNVMVMERIHGIPISNIDALKTSGIDLKQLAEAGVEIFFTQVFRHNFFHADMHPGNIFVSPEGKYIAVDFGIMGSLSTEDKRYLAENFVAFFNRDYYRVAELHVESGWVPSGTRIDEFEAAIRTVCEPIFQRPLKDISFGQLLVRLFQTAQRFEMPIQPQLILLQKTLLNIEGLGRRLYPELDLWTTAKPFLERWLDEQIGIRGFIRSLRKNAPMIAEKLPEIPLLIHEVFEKANTGKLKVRLADDELQRVQQEIRRANRRTHSAIVGAALLISAALIFGLDGYQPQMLAGVPILSWALGGLGTLILLFSWPSDGE